MGQCICCGKTLGGFSALPIKLSPDIDGEFCMKCYDEFSDYIILLQNAKSVDELNKLAENIFQRIHQSQYRSEVDKVFQEYIDKLKSNIVQLYELENQEKQFTEIKSTFLTTTGFNFEGYEIVMYKGVLNESVVLGTGFLSEFAAGISDFFGANSKMFSDKIDTARNSSMAKLIDKSIRLGCNALIGIDFDYITLNNNMIGVIASGTGVVIKPILIETK